MIKNLKNHWATKFSMIVVTTSWAPVVALRTPTIPAHKAPPAAPQSSTSNSKAQGGQPVR